LEAFSAATEMWIEALRQVRNPSRERFEIRDAAGTLLLVLPFSEVLESGRGVRHKAVPSFAVLQTAMNRTRAAGVELTDQIKIAREGLRETQKTLARLDTLSAANWLEPD
jgi:hypothetical protein